MMLALCIFVGISQFTNLPNFYHIKDDLKQSASVYTLFDTYTLTPVLFKPVIGLVSDTVNPFGYKFKSSITIFGLIIICCYTLIATIPFGIVMFTALNFVIMFSVTYINTLALGLTGILTKMEAEGNFDENVDEKKNYGNYLILHSFIKYISVFLGGIISKKVNISQIYLVFNIVPLALIGFTFANLRESKTNRIVNGFDGFLVWMKLFFSLLFKRQVLIPIIFLWLLQLCPNFGYAEKYYLTNIGKWDSFDISIANLVYAFSHFTLFSLVINNVKKVKTKYIMLIGAISLNISNFGNYVMVFIRYIPFSFQFSNFVVQSILRAFSFELLTISIIGKIGKLSPDGYESTSISLVLSFANFASTISGIITAKELDYFDIRPGHYENIIIPSFINHFYSLSLVIISPILVTMPSPFNKKKIDNSLDKSENSDSLINST